MQNYILKLFDQELLRFSAVNTGDTPEVHILWLNSQMKSLLPKGLDATDKSLASWLRHRKIPKNRAYIQSFLAKAGLSVNDTLGIAVICNTDRHFGNFGFCLDARTNKLIGPAPLFDHGNSLFNFAPRLELESKDAFINFANTQTPRCYNDFFESAKPYVTARHRQGLRQLLNFNFKKHPRYNLDNKRLEYMAAAVQNRAARLL